jgi:mannose-1-phosphate guanylyltransferase
MKVFVVMMAGGVGTRFWPRSRRKYPKQVLNIVNHETMIQATYKRLKGIAQDSDIFIVTNFDQKGIIKENLPNLKESNFILEPFGRNTAPCIGLAAIHAIKKDPDSAMLVLPADHIIQDVAEFKEVTKIAVQYAAENEGLITLGIKPTFASTGYGYIQKGEEIAELKNHNIYKVKTFAEKPNFDTAKRFLESGDFFWNSGMFIWKTSTILEEIKEKLPEIYQGLLEIKNSIGTSKYAEKVDEVYRRIRSISIDYGVMQSAENVFVIPADMGWNDVGSWETVYEISEKDKNKIAGDFEDLINVESSECFVHSPEKVVALVGMKNVLVVDTGDALLICKKSHSQNVKDVVDQLHKKGLDELL